MNWSYNFDLRSCSYLKSIGNWRSYSHFDMVLIFDRSRSEFCDCVNSDGSYDFEKGSKIERNKECENFERSYGIDYESDCDNDLSRVYLDVNF